MLDEVFEVETHERLLVNGLESASALRSPVKQQGEATQTRDEHTVRIREKYLSMLLVLLELSWAWSA